MLGNGPTEGLSSRSLFPEAQYHKHTVDGDMHSGSATTTEHIWSHKRSSLPLFFSELGQYSGRSSEVALSLVVLPHEVKHRNVVGLCDNVLLQIRLQKWRLDLHQNGTSLTHGSASTCTHKLCVVNEWGTKPKSC